MEQYRKYVLIALPLFLIHMAEEYLTGFWNVDSWTQSVAAFFNIAPALVYTLANIVWLPLFIYLLFKYNSALLVLFGFLLVFELDRPIHGLILGHYYPGTASSIPLIILGVFFWKSFLKQKMLS